MREPAPPYANEGQHALWHVSEDAGIARFEPHVSATAVYASDETSPAIRRSAATGSAGWPSSRSSVARSATSSACTSQAWIELRVLLNLWPLWNAVVASTVEFSGMRLRNALPTE